MQKCDLVIVGAGLVGLATAYQISKLMPHLKISLLEKEDDVGLHQSGNNSGVIHSGVYYKPGSLKASNCTRGKGLLEAFCLQNQIKFNKCGKIVVALNSDETSILKRIHERSLANGVDCALMEPSQFKEIEPHVSGVMALHVPGTGVVGFRDVSQKLKSLLQSSGVEVRLSSQVRSISKKSKVVISTDLEEYESSLLINCAGLYSDRIALMAGEKIDARVVPFRGEYYSLKLEARSLCRTLIYPVPDPQFPFLGVHVTRMIDDEVECGPNAVLAFARQGYKKSQINLKELIETLAFTGFQKFAWKHFGTGLQEMYRSFSKAAFVRALQRLVPEITCDKLIPAAAGVRAQAISSNGSMIDDFLIYESDMAIHVLNAPSPAATSCLSIGLSLAERAMTRIGACLNS